MDNFFQNSFSFSTYKMQATLHIYAPPCIHLLTIDIYIQVFKQKTEPKNDVIKVLLLLYSQITEYIHIH